MSPRSACLLLVVFTCLSGHVLSADDALDKPDADRFGQPLIRAWIPSTLVAQHEQFEEAIKHEMNPDADTDQLADEWAVPKKREGLLIYYDPEPLKPRLTTEHFSTFLNRKTIPGHPWLKPVRFMKVGSREAFEQQLKEQTVLEIELLQMTFEKRGEGYFLQDKAPIPQFSGYSGPSLRFLLDAQSQHNVFDYLNQTSLYWTYRDGYMFFGDFPEILEMDFPRPRDLEPKGTDADRDIFVQVDLNAVLPRQKRILWDIVRKEFEKQLQQYDDEGDAQYAFRKSVGDLLLNLLQAVTQDLESIRLGVDFASEEKPAEAELELVARPRVNLEHYFGKSGIGTPALAAFVEEPSAMTLATSWGLPERMIQTFEKFEGAIDEQLARQQGWTIAAILASQELAQDLLETVRGNNQLAIKLTQTEHGFTLYGGLHVQNAERVSRNLATVLQGLTNRDGWGVQTSRDESGRTYYSFRPADLKEDVTNHRRRQFPAELHFTVVDEILWFSVGRQDALDVLSGSLDRTAAALAQPVRSAIPLALFDFSFDELFPEQELDKVNGFDLVPLALVQKLDSLIPRQRNTITGAWTGEPDVRIYPYAQDMVDVTGRLAIAEREVEIARMERISNELVLRDVQAEADALLLSTSALGLDIKKLQQFLQPEQSRVRIRFDAGEKRIQAKATVGLGVIEHIYSRMLESQRTIPQSNRSAVLFLDDGTSSTIRFSIELPDAGDP